MLKMKYLPEKHPRKSEIAAREERTQETTEKTSIPSVEHGIVPIPGRLTLLVTETSVPDACLNIPAISCVVTSASAGNRGQFLPKRLKLLILLYFSLL